MKLSPTQAIMLNSALRHTDSGDFDGTCATGAGQYASIKSLAKRGLVKCIGLAMPEDGDQERECFVITYAGRAVLRGEP